MLKHERSQRHIKCLIDLKIFGNVRIDLQLDARKNQSIQQHNEKVRRNRSILQRLIDVVIFLGLQELSFRGHFESEGSNNRGNYKELVYLISKYDKQMESHLDTASIFTGLSNRIQNDLIEAIHKVMLNEMQKEIDQAKFVSILVDETSDVSASSQLSTVLRYVTEDCVTKERFIGFSDVSADRSANALSEHVFKCIETWECGNKLIAQTYDGAATMAGQLNGLQAKVRKKYECAIFIHCYAHILNLVLSQSCSAMKECKIFFSTINGLGTFFTKSPKRTNALDNIVKKRFPKATATRWNYSSRLIITTKENYNFIISLFEHIIENPEAWDETTINSAIGFLHILKAPDFLFLLEVFSDIFSFTDVLFNILQSKSHDIVYCKQQIDKTRTVLENKLDNFSVFYDRLGEKYGVDAGIGIQRSKNISIDPQRHYRTLYNKIISTIVDQIKARYSSLEEFKFMELLNFNKVDEYCKQFPVDSLDSLRTTYGRFFDVIRLQSELNVMYSMKDFKKPSVSHLMSYINSTDLVEAMPELFNLCKLILTIPSTTASVERSFSALSRIKTYQRNATGERRLSGLALMSIEKDLLQELMKREDFYENVIDIFAQKDRRIELIYK
ncbi:finger MYM-type 1-like [Octopus vulgaris]|uniref:Finger MYM-type 1-like n=2 Tax=Octopus vulgaris TaxID=6645 RepID=A0AA36AV14_OCTVU|nr:finger MYM-type 1-like [Octopus vulgaris]